MRKLMLGAAFAMAPLTPAGAQDVATFLVRVHSLQRLGPFALLTPDFYRLKHLVEADGESLKAEYELAKTERRPTHFCPPQADKPRVSKDEFLAQLDAVAADQRATTDTKDVLRTLLERKYPCPA
ncbi:hypothetical protein [Sphingomonas sp.]|uniref:hypothetical protein n=1 Tax=Sphingomonas sp. TaxID=28214 RepID=UPI00286A531C|nr:hypothetical protein [Sphingomonas sp.]